MGIMHGHMMQVVWLKRAGCVTRVRVRGRITTMMRFMGVRQMPDVCLIDVGWVSDGCRKGVGWVSDGCQMGVRWVSVGP